MSTRYYVDVNIPGQPPKQFYVSKPPETAPYDSVVEYSLTEDRIYSMIIDGWEYPCYNNKQSDTYLDYGVSAKNPTDGAGSSTSNEEICVCTINYF